MTVKEYYDLLISSARNGTFPSYIINYEGKPHCLYRADKTAGCKQRCAVGVLIPDEKYKKELENIKIDGLEEIIELPVGVTLDDLRYVQYYHDKVVVIDGWCASKFIEYINSLSCFAAAQKEEVSE